MIPGRVVGWSIRVRLLRWAGMDLGEPLRSFHNHRPSGVVVDVVVHEPEIRDAVAVLDAALRAFAVERWTLDDVDVGGRCECGDGSCVLCDDRGMRPGTFEHRECAREIVMPGCPGGEA